MGNELFSSTVDNIIKFLPKFTVKTQRLLRKWSKGEASKDQSESKGLIYKHEAVVCLGIQFLL